MLELIKSLAVAVIMAILFVTITAVINGVIGSGC